MPYNVWDKECVSNTLTTMQGGGRQPMTVVDVVIGGMQEHQAIKKDGICTTLTSSMGTGGGYIPMKIEEPKCIGGLSDTMWSDTQYHQQDRVYSSDGIAMCHPVNIPQGSYKYLVNEQDDE